jgi:hypothetical protein
LSSYSAISSWMALPASAGIPAVWCAVTASGVAVVTYARPTAGTSPIRVSCASCSVHSAAVRPMSAPAIEASVIPTVGGQPLAGPRCGIRPRGRPTHRSLSGSARVVSHPGPGRHPPRRHPHDAALGATIALDEGVALAVVQEMLGHSDIRVTRGYTHVSSLLAQDAAPGSGELCSEKLLRKLLRKTMIHKA